MNGYKDHLRRYVLPACIVAMWCGMLWARALLSMGMIAFVSTAILMTGLPEAWRAVRREPAAWGLILLFAIPFATFPWSEDKSSWWNAVSVKAPFLGLPFTLAAMRSMPRMIMRRVWQLILVVTFVAIIMVCGTYLSDLSGVNASYLRGAVMRVPMDNDHVRFGWALALVYLLVTDDLLEPDRGLLGLGKTTGWTVLALHGLFILLLSSRTGILGLLLANGIAGWTFRRNRNAVLLLSWSIAIPVIAFFALPSLQNRVRFMVWDYQHYSRGGYREGLNDAPRWISWQAGTDLMRERPFTGTGFGDLLAASNAWYAKNRPDMPAYERLQPSNEWLFHGAASGIPGLLLFCLAVFLVGRTGSGWMVRRVSYLLAVIGFLYEVGTEVQYGVFLFAFFTVWALATETS